MKSRFVRFSSHFLMRHVSDKFFCMKFTLLVASLVFCSPLETAISFFESELKTQPESSPLFSLAEQRLTHWKMVNVTAVEDLPSDDVVRYFMNQQCGENTFRYYPVGCKFGIFLPQSEALYDKDYYHAVQYVRQWKSCSGPKCLLAFHSDRIALHSTHSWNQHFPARWSLDVFLQSLNRGIQLDCDFVNPFDGNIDLGDFRGETVLAICPRTRETYGILQVWEVISKSGDSVRIRNEGGSVIERIPSHHPLSFHMQTCKGKYLQPHQNGMICSPLDF